MKKSRYSEEQIIGFLKRQPAYLPRVGSRVESPLAFTVPSVVLRRRVTFPAIVQSAQSAP